MFKVGISKETKSEQFGDLPTMTRTTAMARTWEFYSETNLKRTRTSVSIGETILFFAPLPHKQMMNTKLVIQSSPQALVRIHKDGASSQFFFPRKPIKKQIIASTHSYEYSNKQSTYVNKLLAYHKEHWKCPWVQNIIICDKSLHYIRSVSH